jgi:hypothetical protein
MRRAVIRLDGDVGIKIASSSLTGLRICLVSFNEPEDQAVATRQLPCKYPTTALA